MGREFLVLWAGRHQRDDWDRLCERYRQRIARFQPLRERAVKTGSASDDRTRRNDEAKGLLAALPHPAWVVALSREGKALDSLTFSALLVRRLEAWPHPIVFIIGSDVGLSPAVLERADERLSLSSMTLPHELARLLLYEQLYRGLTISAGIKYHRARF